MSWVNFLSSAGTSAISWPERRVPLKTVYDRALQRIDVMDRTGYDTVWLAEHHFPTYSVCPSVHLMGMHVADRTERLRIGMAVTLAEDLPEVVDKGPSPFDEAQEKEIASRQEAAMQRLRPADRALLVARIELGYDYKQLARLFGRPTPDAARVAVHRALRRALDAAGQPSR